MEDIVPKVVAFLTPVELMVVQTVRDKSANEGWLGGWKGRGWKEGVCMGAVILTQCAHPFCLSMSCAFCHCAC